MKKEPLTVQTAPHKLESGNTITIARLTGYFDTNDEETAILDYILKQDSNLIMDFSEITGVFIDLFPGVLVKFVDEVKTGGGNVVMTGLSENLKTVFNMLGLDSFITIKDTIEDACEYFVKNTKGEKVGQS